MTASRPINSSQVQHFDVVIAGAGPSGTSCALALKNTGLRVALIDKSGFPRDKICGDAISGMAIKSLRELNPNYYDEFLNINPKIQIHSTRIVNSQGHEAILNWKRQAFNCPRIHFDNFLMNLVRNHTDTHIFIHTKIETAETDNREARLLTDQGIFAGKIMVGCDGANSVISRQMAGFSLNRHHFSGAVRAYYSNVEGCKPGVNEIFFLKKFLPGYFWLFPVSENRYNVGFGMLSSAISKRRINLSQSLVDFIHEFPELKERFMQSELLTKPMGMGLPLGTRRLKISGNRFLLCGDAASLIDPVSGEGIGNSMISGIHAARHIAKNMTEGIFSGAINEAYDKSLYSQLGKELKKNTRMLRIGSKFPFLLQAGFCLISDQFPYAHVIKKLI